MWWCAALQRLREKVVDSSETCAVGLQVCVFLVCLYFVGRLLVLAAKKVVFIVNVR